MNWRYVNHPYIKYYTFFDGRLNHIFRYKKYMPIYIDTCLENINLQNIKKPIFYFEYSIDNEGLVLKKSGNIVSFGDKNQTRINYFDMI